MGVTSLPNLDDYSATERQAAEKRFPAIARYLARAESEKLSPRTQLRTDSWVKCALATVFERASTAEIVSSWTATADQLLGHAWQESGLSQLPIGLMALGKLGARELNLSSDVDVVLIAESSALAESTLKLRKFRFWLEESDFAQPLLRIDFDLRPGGRFGPLITTKNQLTDYYWNQGETWERLAWVRGRPICGDQQILNATLSEIEPFCFRKYLDYTVIDDLKILRNRIHTAADIPEGYLNLKLGPGGIRDLELMVHSLLILHGGKHPELRTPSTIEALNRLSSSGLLPQRDCDFLVRSYWRLRHFEHLVQIYEDQQTHLLPLKPNSIVTEAQVAECQELCKQVEVSVNELLGPIRKDRLYWPDQTSAQIDWLTQMGFDRAVAEEIWPQLESATALSRKSERDESARREFLGRFVLALKEQAADLNLGLKTLLDFVRATRAKATLFTTLIAEPRLISDLARLFSVSPYLGQIISSRPELLDMFLVRRLSQSSPEWDVYLEELVERRQIGEISAASQFLFEQDCLVLGRHLSALADDICIDLLDRIKLQNESSTIQIVALGKWGGEELGIRSDLDFILITKDQPNEADHRVARRLISRLTEVHRGGRIYSIDMRLRPTGHAGPLIVWKNQLEDYILHQAAPWERQAYLRARPIPSEESGFRALAASVGLTNDSIVELGAIRKKLHETKAKVGFDLKLSPGGLVDIEFSIQIACLKAKMHNPPSGTLAMIDRLSDEDAKWAKYSQRLRNHYIFLRRVEQLQQLTAYHSGSVLDSDSEQMRRLARLMKSTSQDFLEEIESRFEQARQWLGNLDP